MKKIILILITIISTACAHAQDQKSNYDLEGIATHRARQAEAVSRFLANPKTKTDSKNKLYQMFLTSYPRLAISMQEMTQVHIEKSKAREKVLNHIADVCKEEFFRCETEIVLEDILK